MNSNLGFIFLAGIDFLDKIKINLDSNELTNKLDEVYNIFQELVKKWDGNDTRKENEIKRNKNVVTKSISAGHVVVKKELVEKRISLNTISEVSVRLNIIKMNEVPKWYSNYEFRKLAREQNQTKKRRGHSFNK